ncbi:MAG TPA: FecR family protein, partial [Terriglobia bacterium]|nr:FecR family protein [Terriglobia bacterium]
MKSHRMRPGIGILVAGLLLLPSWLVAQQGSAPATGLSHVRVVRLSYISGTVAVKRPKSTEWANAIVNTPIQEGYAVSTSSNSFAEVEFENGSTARLGELSEINFTQLAMNAEGSKLNRLALEQGYATFHFLPEHGDVYEVKAGAATFTPDGKSEFRTDIDYGRLRAEVFSGSVNIAAGGKTAKLGKDKILDDNANSTEAFNISHGITKDSWDAWTEARDKQTVLALNDQAVGPRGPLYGWSDLDAYGEWANIPGYGLGWAPYEAFGWSPYSAGLWNWYPSFGWTWISSEPWGWMPYHYGLWNYDASVGWFWMPGDSFDFWSPALVSWYMG